MEKDEDSMFALTKEYCIRNLVQLLNSNWLPIRRENQSGSSLVTAKSSAGVNRLCQIYDYPERHTKPEDWQHSGIFFEGH